jgi:hypothetical protein
VLEFAPLQTTSYGADGVAESAVAKIHKTAKRKIVKVAVDQVLKKMRVCRINL